MRSIGAPSGYQNNTRLRGDVRNPGAYDGYVISLAEYAQILDRKKRGFGQWEGKGSSKR